MKYLIIMANGDRFKSDDLSLSMLESHRLCKLDVINVISGEALGIKGEWVALLDYSEMSA